MMNRCFFEFFFFFYFQSTNNSGNKKRIMFWTLFLLLSAFLLLVLSTSVLSDKALTCKEKGFDSETLLCGVCSKLGEIAGLTLQEECLGCCSSPYKSANLVVSGSVLMQSSDFADFLQNRKQKFSSYLDTSIEQFSRDPHARLTLLGSEPVTLRVNRWSANDLEDFLAQYFPMSR